MFYTIKNMANDYNQPFLICDTVADVSTVPTSYAPGSKILVVSNGDKYILNNNNSWIKQPGSGPSSWSSLTGKPFNTIGNGLTVTTSGELESTIPVATGSGKALVSVNDEWKEQNGYPYEEDIINFTWDGEEAEKETFEIEGLTYVKISDVKIEDPYELIGSEVQYTLVYEESDPYIENIIIKNDNINVVSDQELPFWQMSVYIEDGTGSVNILGVPQDATIMDIPVPSGIWTKRENDAMNTYSYISKLIKTKTYPIDEKYLPETIPTIEQMNDAIASAIGNAIGGSY